jgi:hypothetical protein
MQMQRDIHFYLHKMRYSTDCMHRMPKYTNLLRHKENMMISLFLSMFCISFFFGHVLMISNLYEIVIYLIFWEVDPTQKFDMLLKRHERKKSESWATARYLNCMYSIFIIIINSLLIYVHRLTYKRNVEKKLNSLCCHSFNFLLFPHQNHIFR